MAVMRPINLMQPGLTVGRPLPQMLKRAPPPGVQQANPQPAVSQEARDMARALSGDISVESGMPAEAILEAFTAIMRGRAAGRQAEGELGDERAEEKREQQRRSAIGQAASMFGNPEGMMGALSQGAPEEALDFATVLMREQAQQEPAEQWSEPYMLNGVLVQRNERTGQVRQAVSRPPQPRSGADGGAAPSLPSGFQWEE